MKHKMNPVMDAQLNRNRQRQRGHRRNLSDGRISSATEHLGEDVSTTGFVQTPFLTFYPSSSRLAHTQAYQDGLTPVCPEASRGGWTPSPLTLSALTTRNPTSERAPACSGTLGTAATTRTTAIARDFWQVTGLCVLSVECCAVITPNQSNLLREYTEFESNPPTTESKTGLSNFLPSHRLVGEALI